MTDTQERVSVYISIGNSDDRLTQREWAYFTEEVRSAIGRTRYYRIRGYWLSPGDSAWQNACWCADVPAGEVDGLRRRLVNVARAYRQDSIAFAVAETEFLRPRSEADND